LSAHILLVDDDLRLGRMVADYLAASGYAVQQVTTLAQARQSVARARPVLLVLDLMLPDGDGLDLCRSLRAEPRHADLPVLMLSARGEPSDRIVGLELGADDYLAKPFEPRELLARIKALLRRQAAPSAGERTWVLGRLEVDAAAREVRLDGQRRELTAHQFDLLLVLVRHAGRVMSREQIMESLKGQPLEAFDRSIDVHVSRIRAAIEDDPRQPRRLLTMRGAGYLLVREPEATSSSAASRSPDPEGSRP
jgi:two-component system, OmpR family, phosphate regulon response regulator OmpR